jgi:TRAP-type C4-dicarboxylate transport system permease large subunit
MYGFLIAVNVLIFLLAFFLDFFELCFILVPLLKPAAEAIFRSSPEAVAIAKSLGLAVISTTDSSGAVTEMVADVTPFVIWFGVLLAINMQTSFMHPPFGFALFYLRSVAPKETYQDKVTGRLMPPVKTSDIYWGAVPFLVIQLVMVGLLMAMPSLVISKPDHERRLRAPVSQQSSPIPIPATGSHGFALDPAPPWIEGGPQTQGAGPGAPTLDMRELPSFTAPERTLPR